MDEVIVTVVAVLAVLIFFLLRQGGLGKKQSYRIPPGPSGLPIIGNLHQIKKANPQRFLYDLAKIYGPILSYKLGSQRVVVISSAELAKELLKTQDANFTSRPKHRGQEVTTYGRRDIAFSQYTTYYRDMRKMSINHLFSPTRVASFRRVREEEVQNLIDKISEAAEKSQTINMNELLLSYSNSVICRIALGKKYEKLIEKKRFIKILDDTQALWGTLFYSDIFPYFKFLDDVTGLSAWLREAFKEQDEYLQELINEKLDSNLEKSETESLIDTLMDIYTNQPFSTEFTLENVKAGILDIVIAGTEAAPGVTVWGMTYLMKNREVMKKAQQEIRSIVGNRGFVTEDDIPNLPYFKALVKETMRIEPVVALLIHRTCLEDSKIGGYDIPAGTAVHVNLWAVSRDEEAWGKDAHEFRPERFLDYQMKEIDYKGTDYELTPFGSGRRMCPAMRLGVAMLEVVFANLLYKFNFELPDGMKPGDITLDVLAGVAMHKAQHLLLVPNKFI